MAEPPAQRARRRNETQTNPDSQAAATQQLPAERARYDQQTTQSGSRQPSQQELTQQVPPQLQPRPGETQTNPGPSTAPTQQLPADGVRDDQQMTQSGSRQPSQQEPMQQPPPQLQPRTGETQTNPGPSTAPDSLAAATQQLPADGVKDAQQTTQSGSRQPSQQEPMPQPPPQLQPRPDSSQRSGASIGSIGTISGNHNPIIVGSNVNFNSNLPLEGPEVTGLQELGTFEDLKQQIIDNYKQTATTISAHPTLQSRHVGTDEFFIPLQLIKNITGKTKSERLVTLPEGKIFLDETQFIALDSLDDLFNPEIVKEIKILLFGGVGTGKSTLLVKVANSCITVLRSKPLLGRFDLVFWIKLRQMQQSSCVLDAIFDQILARNTKLTKPIVKGIIDGHESGIALLLDGLDEIPSHVLQSEEGVYRVQDILHSRVLTKSFVLVTTRPHMTEYVLRGHPKYAEVETCGFIPEDRDQYIRLNLPGDMGDTLISYLKTNENIWDVSTIPIISQMLCLVWKNQKSLPERITELFAKFVEVLFIRRNEDKPDQQQMMSIIDGLGRVALQGLLDSRGERLMFDETEFQNCQSCLAEGYRVGFVQRETFTSGLDVKVLATFPHKSIQEYFAACHLAKLLDNGKKKFRHQMKQIRNHVLEMEYLLRFCCGTSGKAAGLILSHIKKMQGNNSKLQRLARLLLFESGSEKLATKLVRPTWIECMSYEDLKSLSYYLQHVTPPLEGTHFQMFLICKQELTHLREILPSDSMESAELIHVFYFLFKQEEEELSLLEEILGEVDEQRCAQLFIVIFIVAKSWFDVGHVSRSLFHIHEQVGSLGLAIDHRSPDEVIDLWNALEGCMLIWLSLRGTNLHARVGDFSHIPSSLNRLQLHECRLADDDVKDLISVLPAGHDLEWLGLNGNTLTLDAVRALTHHLQGLPELCKLSLCNIGLDAELLKQVVNENLPHLKETEEGLFEA